MQERCVKAPGTPRRHDREHDERHVVVRLLKHPPVTREIDEGQEELLAQTDQGGTAAEVGAARANHGARDDSARTY